jgi:tRNA(fMet)-specific endonuclease VapC
VTHLLDTDHISILQRQSGPGHASLAARIAQCEAADLALSIVSFHEQVLGCHTFIMRARKTRDVIRGYAMRERLFSDYGEAPLLPFDAAAAAMFDDLNSRRIRVATMDLRIAAIALSRGLILITRNVSDFGRVPNLPTEDWTI